MPNEKKTRRYRKANDTQSKWAETIGKEVISIAVDRVPEVRRCNVKALREEDAEHTVGDATPSRQRRGVTYRGRGLHASRERGRRKM